MTRSISPRLLQEALRENPQARLVDVRTPIEYREFHVEGAENLPLDRLDAKAIASLRSSSPEAPLYVVCRSGGRSKQACEKFSAAGIDVIDVEGGSLACEQAGLPIVRGKKAMSLERQVRIAAGSLVVLGVALGAFVSPWFLLLAGFVGAGLVFAGVTDTCGMGMLLARMPWNQAPDEAGDTCRVS